MNNKIPEIEKIYGKSYGLSSDKEIEKAVEKYPAIKGILTTKT